VTDTIHKTQSAHFHARTQKLIQLTDCHLYADPDTDHKGVKPGRSLEYVCRHIAERHGDLAVLLLTGDLSQDESVASYEWLISVIASFQVPVYAIPGNHDKREHMLNAFGSRIELAGKIELDHWKILLLDSTVEGQTGGLLSQGELDRLQHNLELSATPCLVALHHHPVPIGSAWMDRLGLLNSEALLSILHRYKQVRATVFGHIHQEFEHRREHVLYLGTPSTCVQFQPRSPDFAIDTRPPAYRVLNLHADGMLDTQVEYVETAKSP
jgi:3',5'-cyclic-AMP phosphodiesterase